MTQYTLTDRARAFAARLYREDVNMHGFMLSVDGAETVRGVYAPFRLDKPHRMYSVSKTMTAIAVGMLAEDGKLSLDDAIARYFEDWMPKAPSPWLAALTIRDMLRMATCYPGATYREGVDDCWARTFFTAAPTHAPGTVFHYDTSCSQVLAELVARLSGAQVMDFLNARLFAPLGLTGERYWLKDPSGCCQGGTGLCMSPEELHAVTQCLMDGGRGVVPGWFAEEMGKKHIDTFHRLNPEERLGYGWQCWRTRAGWSMYGLGGQLAVACPEKGAVLTTIADTGLDGYGVQRIYDAFFEEIYPHIGNEPVHPATLALQNRPLDNDAAFAVASAGEYRFPEGNALGLRRLSLSSGLLRYENARGNIELPFMPGEDIEAPYPGWPGVPAIVKSGWAAPGLLRLRVHATGDAPCGFDMLLCFTPGGVTVQARRSYDPMTADYNGVTASV